MESNQEIFISKKVKRVGLQRYLLSKLAYEVQNVVFADLVCLFENQLWLESKAKSDPNFKKKFGTELDSLAKRLKELNLTNGLTSSTLLRLSTRIKVDFEDFVFPHRNYAQMKAKFSGTYTPRYRRPLGTPTKLLPPKAFIGKGYGDKGTAQEPALDASPSWQEVAQVVANKERLQHEEDANRILNAKNIDELEAIFTEIVERKEQEVEKPVERRGDKDTEKNPAGTKKAWYRW